MDPKEEVVGIIYNAYLSIYGLHYVSSIVNEYLKRTKQ